MDNTKEYLINQLQNGNISLIDFQDEKAKQIFSSFKELEQKIWAMGTIYNIAGYEKNDKSHENEKTEEICKVLGISKIKYIKTTILMGFHSIKILKNAAKEIDNTKVDEYLFSKKDNRQTNNLSFSY